MKEIPLTQGKVAVVDDEDFDLVSQRKWRTQRSADGRRFYVVSGKGKHTVRMHRLVMGVESELYVDHRDSNGLNNCKDNLRLATNSQNQANRGRPSNNASGYKGVHWCKRQNRWVARIMRDGERIVLGEFSSKEEAARAYDAKAKELFGEFAKLNLPEGWLI